jgi:predicted phosphodiesterase
VAKKGQPGDDVIRALYPTEPMQTVIDRLKESTGREWSKKDAFNRAHAIGVLRQVRDKQLPPSLGTVRRPITIDADRMILCSDSHIPFHDRDTWAAICEVARQRKCDTLVHVGDLMDCQAFAKFDPMVPPVKWEDEVRTASALIVEIANVFKRIVLLTGNHEARIVKRMAGQLPFSDIMKAWECWDIVGDNVKTDIEDLPVAYLGHWGMVCHPANYSQTSGAVAVRLTEKYHRDVFMGHDHYMALRYDRSGRYKAVSLGCCTRDDMTDYLTTSVTTNPRWNKGFVSIVDRRPILHPM